MRAVDVFAEEIALERQRQISLGYDFKHDHEHGLDHLLLWAQEYALIGKTIEAVALMEAARQLLNTEVVWSDLS